MVETLPYICEVAPKVGCRDPGLVDDHLDRRRIEAVLDDEDHQRPADVLELRVAVAGGIPGPVCLKAQSSPRS